MKDMLIQFDDLPDEILLYIFKNLFNDQILYSLMNVNQRLNRIVNDKCFIHHLYLLKYCPIDNSIICPLSDSILNRFCSNILPQIGYQIESLYLERTSIERILHVTNYPNLNHLGLYDIHYDAAMSLFNENNPLLVIFKNQISSLFINFNKGNISFPMATVSSIIFRKIFTMFSNLQCLKFNPSSSYLDAAYLHMADSTIICSTILELHISVSHMNDCLYILDGRFKQLRIFYVTIYNNLSCLINNEYKENLLPNLKIFSLYCKNKIENFDKSIGSLLRRMLNLEELYLNIRIKCYEKFLDGDILNKNILIFMPQLYKFIFNIYSIINHNDQMNFQLNEQIEKTFKDFSNNQIITYIDHFQEGQYSQCHIYSYPYKFQIYDNISNHFPGGLFPTVTQISLYDEYPFEYDLFIQISQSFPYMKPLTINNKKRQINKQLNKIIQYPNLNRLDLTISHDDYLDLFLFNTNIFLPNNLHLCVNYQSLKRVTYNFTRFLTQNHSTKLAALYSQSIDQNKELIKNYFPHTSIYSTSIFLLSK